MAPDAATVQIGAAIAAARAKHNISIEDAASKIGISRAALRALERGKGRSPHGDTLFMILYWAGGLGYSEFAGFDARRHVRRANQAGRL